MTWLAGWEKEKRLPKDPIDMNFFKLQGPLVPGVNWQVFLSGKAYLFAGPPQLNTILDVGINLNSEDEFFNKLKLNVTGGMPFGAYGDITLFSK